MATPTKQTITPAKKAIEDRPQEALRPTKKQKELLTFIEEFIVAHGYSPSYREVMKGLQYNSVATVSLHINNLIRRGHLHKRDHSARSLEVAKPTILASSKLAPKQLNQTQEKWLVEKVELFFKEIESTPKVLEKELDKLYVLIGALKVLGLDGAAQSYIPRLTKLKTNKADNQYSV